MRTIAVAAIVFTIGLSSVAFAESAQEMLSVCKEFDNAKITGDKIAFKETYETGLCWGAFSVVAETIRIIDSETGRRMFFVCSPEGVYRPQLIAIFVEYARRNPQHLHKSFYWVARDSLREAFPCNYKGEKK